MIHTSYYTSPIVRDSEFSTVGISAYPPFWAKDTELYEPLAPDKRLLSDYKNSFCTKAEYVERYRNQLSKLDPVRVAKDLDGKTMLCFEKIGDFCHRHILEAWLREHSISCEERNGNHPKIAVVGSRGFDNYDMVKRTLLNVMYHYGTFEVVCGCAKGADKLGECFALEYGLKIHKFIPDWDKYGKSAGMVRNREMSDIADMVIAFWDGSSRGTKHMIEYSVPNKKNIFVFDYALGKILKI